MAFQYSDFATTGRVQHWHGGDKWEDMEEVAQVHDADQADSERSWAQGRVFRCSGCDEQFRITEPDDTAPGHDR